MARLLPRNDLLFKVFPIDCDELRPRESPPRDRVKIVHAPNHRNVKGTPFLLDAIDKVQASGFSCELVMVERVPRSQALELFADADIIADQFCMGAWAQFALEGMALGKPVLAYLDQESLGDPVFNVPIVNATAENLAAVLAAMIGVPELRTRIAAASRDSVERYHSVAALGEVWSRLYRHVWAGESLDFSGTAHFSPERTARSFTEDPLDEDFWPVPVRDLAPRIEAAIRRLS